MLFSISNLLISDAFPAEDQSLAGGVFNEVAQFGNSVGLAVTAAIAASVTEHSSSTSTTDALMDGFRAGFWTIFASTAAVLIVSSLGFWGAGTIGQKDESADESMSAVGDDASGSETPGVGPVGDDSK